jgi:phosphoribosyl-ATP pyrophosphohydrolase/phosphoribosyl-AMP cyclohydrolase
MTTLQELSWDRSDGLLPAIVQDCNTGAVLMLAYMNREALELTRSSGRVTFWSRSRGRLWTKGETSGNYLELREIAADCDGDAILVLADPKGPACHLGTATCWGENAPRAAAERIGFLAALEQIILQRIEVRPKGSYTAKLLAEGTRRIIGEAADLLYHSLLLLQVKHLSLAQVVAELEARHAGRSA